MAVSKLDIELGKIDMKFSPGKRVGDRSTLDFFIRYCSPQAVEMPGEGITVSMHRFQPDRMGRSGLAVLENTYPLSFEGLETARRDGLFAVKDLYSLPNGIQVVETASPPQFGPDTDYNKIYRVDFMQMLQLLAHQDTVH